MSGFDQREEGFEKKFAHDEELRFKANARRAKLLGAWAAEKLGKIGADAEAYAKSMVAEDMSQPGDADIVAKVIADLKVKGIEMSEHRVRKELEGFAAQAREQLMKE